MADNFQRPQRKKNALDNAQLSLSANCPTAQGKRSSLSMNVIANNPRITVYTNDPNDANNNYGKITANLNLPVFGIYLEMLQQAVDFVPTPEKPEFKTIIGNKNFIFPGGQRSKEPVPVSELHVGKNKEGVVWVAVLDKSGKDRPRIQFPFTVSNFHDLRWGDGTALTPAEVSVLAARSHLRIWRDVMYQLVVNEYVEPPKKEFNGNGGGNRNGGGGNYGGNRGGGGGGYNGGGGNSTNMGSTGGSADDDLGDVVW